MECTFSAGAQSAKRPQAGISATQGTSSSALSAGSQSGSGSLLPGSSGVSQPRKASDALGQTGKQPAEDTANEPLQSPAVVCCQPGCETSSSLMPLCLFLADAKLVRFTLLGLAATPDMRLHAIDTDSPPSPRLAACHCYSFPFPSAALVEHM